MAAIKFSSAMFVFFKGEARFEVCFEGDTVQVSQRNMGELYGERLTFSNPKKKGSGRKYWPCTNHCTQLIKLMETRQKQSV